MADTKITALTAITTVDPAADVLPIVDVSDTSMAASGTTKKITSNQILGSGGTATLASATITGDLTVDTSTLKVDSANNRVGIGTATPSSALEVVGAASISGNTTSSGFIVSGASSVSGAGMWGLASALAFNVNSTEGMRLTSTGLGVGGIPAATIHAYGSGSSTAAVRLQAASGRVFDVGSTGSGYGAANNFIIYDVTAGSERLRIDASGNCGIGVTPSAWGSTYRALQIGIGTSLTGVTNDVDVNLVNNARFDGTNWKYTNTSPAERYRTAAGTHFWYNAASGTAGNNITWTQSMTLDASGNLLVGKSSASATTIGFEGRANGTVNSTLASSVDANATYAAYSTGAAAYRFYVGMGGTVYATNTTISAISDARLKENVQDIDVGLGAILALKPRKFDWKAGKGKDIKGDRGFIAQEFEQVFPQLVDEWKDAAPEGEAPYKSVRQDLIPVLVKAIQELTARVQTLETR